MLRTSVAAILLAPHRRMPFAASPLAAFIAERIFEGASGPELFTACDAAGLDLADVLDVLAAPFEHFAEPDAFEVEELVDWKLRDIIYQLVEHAGPTIASEVVARSSRWRDVDVVARHAGVAARLRAEVAIIDEDPVASAYALVADPVVPEEHRWWLLERIARVYPIAELTEIAEHVSDDHAATMGAVLREHQTPLAAFDELVGHVEAPQMLVALERFWRVPRHEGDERDALLSTFALLARTECRPFRAVARFAAQRGTPSWWLPILRKHGLKGSHAALFLLEAATERVAIAELLSTAGYSDDHVLDALLENGIGSRATLATLRTAGWRIERMLETLAAHHVLLPEVRRHLEDLGILRIAQRPLLLRHWPERLVDLVLSAQATTLRLPRAIPEPGDHE